MTEVSPPTGRDDPPRQRFVEAHNPKGLNPEHPENAGLRLLEDLAKAEYELITPGVKEVLELLFDTKKPENEARWRSLIDSTVAYVEAFLPMLGLTGGSPDSDREGRGNYLPIHPPKDSKEKGLRRLRGLQKLWGSRRPRYLYTKGSGNKFLLQGDRAYQGFPDLKVDDDAISDTVSDEDINKVFYDYLQPGIVPRIKGAASFDSARNEFVNAAVVFAEIAKRQAVGGEVWTDVAQAVDAGVTIPVGVLSLPRLSEHQWDQAQQELDKLDKSSEEYRFYSNFINKNLAIVGLVVPSNKRRYRRETGEWFDQILDKDIMITTARTLRGLIDIGMVYHRASAHAQNMGTEGLMAQADNEDLIFLGNYKSDNRKTALIREILSNQFIPSLKGLTATPEYTLRIQEIQKELLRELLRGVVGEDDINQLSEQLNNNPQGARLAIARLFVDRSRRLSPGDIGSSSHWERVARDREKVLSLF